MPKDLAYCQSKCSKCRPAVLTHCAAVHATGRLPRQWHSAADLTMQQSGAASDQQRRV